MCCDEWDLENYLRLRRPANEKRQWLFKGSLEEVQKEIYVNTSTPESGSYSGGLRVNRQRVGGDPGRYHQGIKRRRPGMPRKIHKTRPRFHE